MIIYFNPKSLFGGKNMVLIISLFAILLLLLAAFFYCKSKKLQMKLAEEIAEVSGSSGIEKYRKIGGGSTD